VRIFQALFLTQRFFLGLALLVVGFACCFFLPAFVLPLVQVLLLSYLVLALADGVFLFRPRTLIDGNRNVQAILSLGSENQIQLTITNSTAAPLVCSLVDELPAPFQNRNFELTFTLQSRETKELVYKLTPKTRGVYAFGDLLFFCRTPLGLVERRQRTPASRNVQVYPSVIEMKKHELMASQRLSLQNGMRKIRRIGHSYDFDHIKEYARGDDPRGINWKATGKLNRLMVNHYEDEKSQQIYSVLDLGRNMSSPFDGMSLLDYCVNASLVLSRIILQKDDKAGLLALGDKAFTLVSAERGSVQLGKLMGALYNVQENEGDASLERLYQLVRTHIRIRSLLMYFTNIESLTQLERILPMLERIKSRHLLVVVLFENAEVARFTQETKTQVADVYAQTVARTYLFEKQQMAHRLRRAGIYTLLTQPKDLTIQSINQYLEFKARGLI